MWCDVAVRTPEPKKLEAFRSFLGRCMLGVSRCGLHRPADSPHSPAHGGPSPDRPEAFADRRRPARRRRPFRSGLSRIVHCLALMLTLLTALAMTPPAQTQDVIKLVGNVNQESHRDRWLLNEGFPIHGNSFTTGGNRGAYIGDHVELSIGNTQISPLMQTRAKLYSCAPNASPRERS